jgi:hypothetical protein
MPCRFHTAVGGWLNREASDSNGITGHDYYRPGTQIATSFTARIAIHVSVSTPECRNQTTDLYRISKEE